MFFIEFIKQIKCEACYMIIGITVYKIFILGEILSALLL